MSPAWSEGAFGPAVKEGSVIFAVGFSLEVPKNSSLDGIAAASGNVLPVVELFGLGCLAEDGGL